MSQQFFVPIANSGQSTDGDGDQNMLAIPQELGLPVVASSDSAQQQLAVSSSQVRVMADRLTLVQNDLATYQGEFSVIHHAVKVYGEVQMNMEKFIQWHRYHEQNFAFVSAALEKQDDKIITLVLKLNEFAVDVFDRIASRSSVEALRRLECTLSNHDQQLRFTNFNQSELSLRQDHFASLTVTQDQV